VLEVCAQRGLILKFVREKLRCALEPATTDSAASAGIVLPALAVWARTCSPTALLYLS
jgi:hypothetical protein